jgi:hypothetical protein
MQTLAERVKHMLEATPDSNKEYYALSIFLGETGKPEYTSFTGFVAFTDDSRRHEIREASLVHADRMLDAWRQLEEPGMVVNTPDEFGLFFSFGGHAVVEQTLAESVVPEWLAPNATVRVGEWGFASPSCLPSTAMQRAPAPKLRMRIIKRDAFRCRVCGRSPSEHGDLELHVHHVRPWAAGGVTEERNLITLCHTCHNGLDPHYEHALFRLLPQDTTDRATKYRSKLQRYQAEASRHSRESDV